MQKKLTITIDEDVDAGLYQVVGRRKISRFIESSVRPYVIYGDIQEGYRQMAADTEREAEAMEWVEGTAEDIRDETRSGLPCNATADEPPASAQHRNAAGVSGAPGS